MHLVSICVGSVSCGSHFVIYCISLGSYCMVGPTSCISHYAVAPTILCGSSIAWQRKWGQPPQKNHNAPNIPCHTLSRTPPVLLLSSHCYYSTLWLEGVGRKWRGEGRATSVLASGKTAAATLSHPQRFFPEHAAIVAAKEKGGGKAISALAAVGRLGWSAP